MSLNDWLTILAIIAAPIIALRISVFLDDRRAQQKRRVSIYVTLMATRATVLHPEHVRALNSIDVEFYGGREFDLVRASWKALIDTLEVRNPPELSDEQWVARVEDLRIDLYHNMGLSLGYSIDKTHIKRAAYSPRGHGEVEGELHRIRKATLEILEGRGSIPIHPRSQDDLSDGKQLSLLRSKMLEVLEGKSALLIKEADSE